MEAAEVEDEVSVVAAGETLHLVVTRSGGVRRADLLCDEGDEVRGHVADGCTGVEERGHFCLGDGGLAGGGGYADALEGDVELDRVGEPLGAVDVDEGQCVEGTGVLGVVDCAKQHGAVLGISTVEVEGVRDAVDGAGLLQDHGQVSVLVRAGGGRKRGLRAGVRRLQSGETDTQDTDCGVGVVGNGEGHTSDVHVAEHEHVLAPGARGVGAVTVRDGKRGVVGVESG